jgi:hypothetical protein
MSIVPPHIVDLLARLDALADAACGCPSAAADAADAAAPHAALQTIYATVQAMAASAGVNALKDVYDLYERVCTTAAALHDAATMDACLTTLAARFPASSLRLRRLQALQFEVKGESKAAFDIYKSILDDPASSADVVSMRRQVACSKHAGFVDGAAENLAKFSCVLGQVGSSLSLLAQFVCLFNHSLPCLCSWHTNSLFNLCRHLALPGRGRVGRGVRAVRATAQARPGRVRRRRAAAVRAGELRAPLCLRRRGVRARWPRPAHHRGMYCYARF